MGREYDQQSWASGNPYIAIGAGMVGRRVRDFDARILGAGCGTGNMGQILHQIGYNRLDGLEPSAGMLEVARRKNVYRELHPLYLDAEIDLPPESYDAVVAAGVLTHGHARPAALDGILALTRSGGIIVFSLSQIAYDDYGFRDKLNALDAAGRWEPLERSRLFRTCPFSEREAQLRQRVMTYRKR